MGSSEEPISILKKKKKNVKVMSVKFGLIHYSRIEQFKCMQFRVRQL